MFETFSSNPESPKLEAGRRCPRFELSFAGSVLSEYTGSWCDLTLRRQLGHREWIEVGVEVGETSTGKVAIEGCCVGDIGTSILILVFILNQRDMMWSERIFGVGMN